MDPGVSLIVAVKSAAVTDQIVSMLRRCNYDFVQANLGAEVLQSNSSVPTLLITDGLMPDTETGELPEYLRGDSSALRYILWIANPDDSGGFLLDQVEDCLMQPFTIHELRARIRNGLRQLDAWRQIAELRQQLNQVMREAEDSSEIADRFTTESVEIAALLQSEIFQRAALEAEHIRLARVDTVVQAAATLRHEINNPLFVISGSAETLSRRLKRQTEAGFDIGEFQPAVRRILEASERIRQVVQAFSTSTTALSVDYLPGIPMIDLPR